MEVEMRRDDKYSNISQPTGFASNSIVTWKNSSKLYSEILNFCELTGV